MTVIGWKPVGEYNPNAYLVALNAKNNPLSNIADTISGLGDLGIQYADRAKEEFDLRSKIAKSEQDMLDQRNKIYANEWLADNTVKLNDYITRGSKDYDSMLGVQQEINQISNPVLRQAVMNHVSTALNNRMNYNKYISDLENTNASTESKQLANNKAKAQLGPILDAEATRTAWSNVFKDSNNVEAWSKVTSTSSIERFKKFQEMFPQAGNINYETFVTLDKNIGTNMVSSDLKGLSDATGKNIDLQAPALQKQVFSSFSFPFNVGHMLDPNIDPSTEGINAVYGNTIAQSKNKDVTQQRVTDAAAGLNQQVSLLFKQINNDKSLTDEQKNQLKESIINNPANRLLATHSILRNLTNKNSVTDWFLGEETATKPDWNYDEEAAYNDFKKYHGIWQGKEKILRPLFGTNGLLTKEHFTSVRDRAVTYAVQNKVDYQTALEAIQNEDLDRFFHPDTEHGQRYTSQQRDRIKRAYKEAFGSNPLSSVNLFAGTVDQYPGITRITDKNLSQFTPAQINESLSDLNRAEENLKTTYNQVYNNAASNPNVTGTDLLQARQFQQQLKDAEKDIQTQKQRVLDTDKIYRKSDPTRYSATLDQVLTWDDSKPDKNYSYNDLEQILIDGFKINQKNLKKAKDQILEADPEELGSNTGNVPTDFSQIFETKKSQLERQIRLAENIQEQRELNLDESTELENNRRTLQKLETLYQRIKQKISGDKTPPKDKIKPIPAYIPPKGNSKPYVPTYVNPRLYGIPQ